MNTPGSRTGSARIPHWIVQINYRMRTAAFAMVFVGLGQELWHKQVGYVTWTLFALQFLVYPHILYWRARRAADSQKAELNNLLLDSLLIGVWIAALHFPLWPSFTLLLAGLLNITISRGYKGTLQALLASSLGMFVAVMFFGFKFSPDTGWATTIIVIVGMSAYLVAIGNASFVRNRQLRQTREKLREGELVLQRQIAEIQTLQAQLNEQAIRDPLTGLHNRRYLDSIVPHELARCGRDLAPLSVMMMDIDHFKHVNDTYGHQGGDEVLRQLAKLLIDNVRASDVACRYGGEEFFLLLPNMPVNFALVRAEQWRAAFAATTTVFGEAHIQATVSIGIACYPNDGVTSDELIRSADLALYRAKAEGRNRVVLATAGQSLMN